MICLDTNAVIAAINRRKPIVRTRLEQAFAQGLIVAVPVIVLYEIWYGITASMQAAMMPSGPAASTTRS